MNGGAEFPDAAEIVELCRHSGAILATAESCTGGMVAAAITDIAGASAVFERGFVTYSNRAKSEMLGVPADLIERHGAVSSQVAEAMGEGALAASAATHAVAVTGIAGPGGGSPGKPVGLVYFCAVRRDGKRIALQAIFPDAGRAAVRSAAVATALQILKQLLRGN